jgi:hypothetical protein
MKYDTERRVITFPAARKTREAQAGSGAMVKDAIASMNVTASANPVAAGNNEARDVGPLRLMRAWFIALTASTAISRRRLLSDRGTRARDAPLNFGRSTLP